MFYGLLNKKENVNVKVPELQTNISFKKDFFGNNQNQLRSHDFIHYFHYQQNKFQKYTVKGMTKRTTKKINFVENSNVIKLYIRQQFL